MASNKILIVDDEQATCDLIKGILEDYNLKMFLANLPEEAMQLANNEEYALLILDVNLPDMTGYELAWHIRENSANTTTPIIFISGFYNDPKSIMRGYMHGAVDFVTKPIDEIIFKSKVGVFLQLFEQKQKIREQNDELQERYAELLKKDQLLKEANLTLESEVEEKTSDLNAKIEELKKAREELISIKNHLAERVEKRTEQLALANTKLKKEINFHQLTKEKLLKSESELKRAQEIAKIGNWRWNLKDDSISWSDTMYSIYGLEKNGKYRLNLNTLLNDMVHPEDRKILKNLWATAKGAQKTRDFEFRIITPKGEVKHIHAISYTDTDEDGKPVTRYGTTQDITEQKKAQLELKTKKEQLKLAVDASRIVVYDYYVKDGTVHLSEEIKKLYGFSAPKTLTAEKVKRFLFDDDLAVMQKDINKCIEGEKNEFEVEFRLKIVNGKIRYFINRGKVLERSENGRALKISGTFVDITRLREAENQLKEINANLEQRVQNEIKKREQQQQLVLQKSKLESLGELAAGIAHEISHPLSVISLSVDNILRKAGKNGTYDQYMTNKCHGIQKSINKISEIIKQIRIFSRDQKAEELLPVDINRVIQNAVLLVQTQFNNHNIALDIDLGLSQGYILGNENKLEQVLFNLLSNSKYAVEEKNNQLESVNYQMKIEISTYQKNNYIYIGFWDNGVGITEEGKKRIFDPFYTTKDKEIGTGLGLSVVYGIIKEMNGTIKVESKEGKYTFFSIKFPQMNDEQLKPYKKYNLSYNNKK
ncbi:MAG: PAS domain-containing protein [Bacteroidales bacterium]|nr:PAS domain-containing protein [Bacteroidales bacterium]